MTRAKTLRLISAAMLTAAVIFVICAMCCPTCGRTITVFGVRIGGDFWRTFYALYVLVMFALFLGSFLTGSSRPFFARLALLAGYAVPWAGLAVWRDAASGAVLWYGVLFLAQFLLCRAAIRIGYRVLVPAGCGLSLLTSVLLAQCTETEKWLYYFKPLTGRSMLVVLSAAALAMQLVMLLRWRKPQ